MKASKEESHDCTRLRHRPWLTAAIGKIPLATQLGADPQVRERFTDGILWMTLDRPWAQAELEDWLPNQFSLPLKPRAQPACYVTQQTDAKAVAEQDMLSPTFKRLCDLALAEIGDTVSGCRRGWRRWIRCAMWKCSPVSPEDRSSARLLP